MSMIDKTVRIDLRLVPANKVLTSSAGLLSTSSGIPVNATYSVKDVCTYSRML
jgi:hypothetical protein